MACGVRRRKSCASVLLLVVIYFVSLFVCDVCLLEFCMIRLPSYVLHFGLCVLEFGLSGLGVFSSYAMQLALCVMRSGRCTSMFEHGA